MKRTGLEGRWSVTALAVAVCCASAPALAEGSEGFIRAPVATAAVAVPVLVESVGQRGQRVSVQGPADPVPGAICETPCLVMVPAGNYVLASDGRGIRTGRSPIEVTPAGLTVRLREPTRAGFAGGVALTSFGVGALALGALVVIGVVANGGAGDPYNQMFMATVGGSMAVIGIPSVSVGLWMIHRHRAGIASTAVGPPAVQPPPTPWTVAPTLSSTGAGLTFAVGF